MPRKSAFFAVVLMLLSPVSALALGLGEIKLNSYLNEPLDADISLISLQPSDLDVFSAEVASLETFSRYGLDRPDYLSSLRFRVINGSDGQPMLKVSSAVPMTEPFLTFLVEANWSRGRLLREYTLLLDPPIFNAQSEAPPVSAPQSAGTQTQPQAGFVPRPVPAPVPSPAPAPRRPEAAPIAAGSTYGPVRRNQTLWEIANGARRGTGLSVNQMMIAIYRANPEAFLGNINLIKEGSTLSLPGAAEASSISRSEATSAAQQHNQSWRSGGKVAAAPSAPAPSAGDSSRRLRLVAPGEEAQAPASSAPVSSGDLGELRDMLRAEEARNSQLADDVASIRRELEETRRLFNLQSAELADLQARLGDQQSAGVSAGGTELAVAPLAGAEPGAQDTPDDSQTPAVTADTQAPEPPDSTAVTPETVADTTPTPAGVTSPAPASEGIVAKIIGFLSGFWIWIVAAAALAGAAFVALRRDRSDDSDSWEALSQESAEPAVAISAAEPAAAPAAAASTEDVEYYEDTGTFKPVDFAEASAEAGAGAGGDLPFEDTLSGEEALKLDQSDPLAEADFHMAYGLYDQAAELVRGASERDPSRRDLKMKLLEIYFVWGNKDAFLESASALHAEIGGASDADWDKILIMGKQICPEEALFSGSASGSGADSIDLQLEDTGSADIDLMTDAQEGDEGIDLDLGEALGAAAATAASVDNVIDFDFGTEAAEDEEDTAVERVRSQIKAATDDAEDTEEMDLNELGIDLDFGETGSLDEDDAFVGIDTDNAPRDESDAEIDVSEDFDQLFAGLDDPVATSVISDIDLPGVDLKPSASLPAEGDKLLDTSELKVEMEELLAAGDALAEDEGTERSLEAMADDSATVQVGDAAAETGSFSAEIKSLAGEAFDIDLDIGESESDDDATALMEAVDDQTGEAGPIDDFADVFGGDDDTVLAETLIEAPEDLDRTALMEDADSTAMMKVAAGETGEATDEAEGEAVDFGDVFGSDDPTQLSEAAFDDGQFDAQAGDDKGLADVFAADADGQPTEQLEHFSGDAIAAGEEHTEELNQVDLDVGDSLSESAGDGTTVKVAATNLALPDADPTAANEVGTKLDLARAYMEMGDPDGARGILQEVIEEGDSSQQDDARALLKALP